MRKYIVGLFVLGTLLISSVSVNAQSFAGGEIYVEYIGDGSEACGDPLPYSATLRFFRDDPATANALAATKDIFLVNVTSKDRTTWVPPQRITLDSIRRISRLDNICLNNDEVVTDGAYYRNQVEDTIWLDANRRYRFIHGDPVGGGISYDGIGNNLFQSPTNSNIDNGQKYFLKTEVHTFCEDVITGQDDTPSEERITYNLGKNRAPEWEAKTEILETLCERNNYRFDLQRLTYDTDVTATNIFDVTGNFKSGPFITQDSVTFRLKGVQVAEDRSANYSDPFNVNPSNPFPTDPNDPFTLNRVTGELTFTPLLAPGTRVYSAPWTVETIEWKKVYYLEDDGQGQNTFIRRERWDTATITQRQFRFLIADELLCNNQLPNVVGYNYNQTEQAYEFNCADTSFAFRFDKPMLERSIAMQTPFDFRVFRGTDPLNPIDESAYEIDAIRINPDSINRIGEVFPFRLIFKEGLGPGRYSLFTRVGNDTNTVENRCGFFMPEYQVTPFIVNTTYEYLFKDDDVDDIVKSQKVFCYPGDAPVFNMDALEGQGINVVKRADLFRFQFTRVNGAPPILDTTQINNSKFNVYNTITIPDPYVYPTTPLGNETQGVWRVGVGLNYPWYEIGTGKKQDERCYDDDVTSVEFRVHPEVRTVDIDLCRQERWPVIKDLIDPQFTTPGAPSNPINYSWVKIQERVLEEDEFDPVTGQLIGFKGETVITSRTPIGGSSNGNSQSSGNVNDTLDLEAGVGVGVGISSLQKIKVYVTFPNGCVDSNTIKIVKQDVNVVFDTGVESRDTTICIDETFHIINSTSEEYLRPEYMSRQWYFGENAPTTLLPGDTTDTLSAATMRQNGRGWYKLVVTKTTEESTCEGSDSIFVRVADSLIKTDPVCSIVTFEDGEVKQRFYWSPVDGADRYEVRGVNQAGEPLDSLGTSVLAGGVPEWYNANDTYGIHHWISGKEVRLYVRAINLEVPEGTDCRNGEAMLAESCEVLVKPTNVFTPNGDGINDLLRFDLLELFEGNTLQVFNRWGKMVYESNDYQNDWDGGDLKDGTYFYVLDIDDPSGLQDIFKGTITILR